MRFADPIGARRQRMERVLSNDPNYDDDPDSDPFKELRKKMKFEKEKLRKFKIEMSKRKNEMLRDLSE